ncbi:MAG TPA: hypothetical protein VI566_12330 [Xanthomonadales bacterium]|nr:hypothetical protein [Xanthomonadales bacterium]
MQQKRTLHRIYSLTSIGRPLDPAWPSNKAVLILMPLAALAGLVYAFYLGLGMWQALQVAAVFALAVFGTWALARELLPDDQVAAFISMALGFLAALVNVQPGLLVLFSTLGLVRIVNRSTGLAPRASDSILVTLLVIGTIYASQSPWLGAVAALAFFLDGILHKPVKKQWLYAVICFGAMVVYMVDHDVAWWMVVVPDSLLEWLALLTLLLFSLNLFLLKKVHSRGDTDNLRLDVQRVKGGMAIGVLATLQGLEAMPHLVLVVATIGGLCLGIAFRRAFRSPAKGLRAG